LSPFEVTKEANKKLASGAYPDIKRKKVSGLESPAESPLNLGIVFIWLERRPGEMKHLSTLTYKVNTGGESFQMFDPAETLDIPIMQK